MTPTTVVCHVGNSHSKVPIHFDVDTIDAAEIRYGLGADVGGLTSEQARRVVGDITAEMDVVALTIAEFIPRQGHPPAATARRVPLLAPAPA